jgi:hypothetical protein
MFILIGDPQFQQPTATDVKKQYIPKCVMYQESRNVPEIIILMQN